MHEDRGSGQRKRRVRLEGEFSVERLTTGQTPGERGPSIGRRPPANSLCAGPETQSGHRVFSRPASVFDPRGVRFVRGHPGNLGLRQTDGEEQPRHQPTRNGLDSRSCYLSLGSRPPADDLPEPLLRDLELIAKDPMEQVLANLGVGVVRDLRSQTGAIG